MALETVVFPHDLLGLNGKQLCSLAGEGEAWSHGGSGGGGGGGSNWNFSCSSMVQNLELDVKSLSPETCTAREMPAAAVVDGGRRKRRRARSCKNKEEVESQRMTHIAVERNRRKQMNEYLAVLRSLMPPSYIQRGDQASIIGGAINYVKELEQLLHSLEAQKRTPGDGAATTSPFSGFFAFPQYSSCSSTTGNESVAGNRLDAAADIEVTMAESHANLKILTLRRPPKQLLKMVAGLQNLRLTTLHLNVTSVEQLVLYTFSVKIEEGCRYTTVDEIATAVYQLVRETHDERTCFN